MRIDYRHLKVFTSDAKGGNDLAFVDWQPNFTPQLMQKTAAAIGFPETIFCRLDSEVAARVKIFTPVSELAFAGHPLIGASFFLFLQNGIKQLAFIFPKGRVFCEAVCEGDTVVGSNIQVPFEPASFESDLQHQDAADLLGIKADEIKEIIFKELGPKYALIELSSEEALLNCRIQDKEDPYQLAYYIYHIENKELTVRARLLAPSYGIPEDPATGSAACCLAGVLAGKGILGGVRIIQGRDAQTGGAVELHYYYKNEKVHDVGIKGECLDKGQYSILVDQV